MIGTIESVSKNFNINFKSVGTDVSESEVYHQHIIYCVDISGSMSSDLPEVRRHLKNHLVTSNISDNTVISIVAFSGKDQCYTVAEKINLQSLTDIDKMHKAIDKFLLPMCLTAFYQPLNKVSEIIESSDPKMLHSLIFMTDGYNNDSSYESVLEVLKSLETKVSSSAFIEYGYYADSKSLNEMAETVGGEKVFAKDFNTYSVEFKALTGKHLAPIKKISIKDFKQDLKFPFVYYTIGESIYSQSTKYKDEILLPENVYGINYFSKTQVPDITSQFDRLSELYTAVYVLLDKNKFFEAEEIAVKINDSNILQLLQGCYGKQKFNNLKSIVKDCIFEESARNIESVAYVPNTNKYSLVELINDLSDDENATFFPDHESFEYNRIGRKMVTKCDDGENDVAYAEILYNQNGYPLSDLVFNESRANVSIRVKYDIDVHLPSNNPCKNITGVNSFMWRNYTVICDGIVNIPLLPVRISEKLLKKISSKMNILYDNSKNIHVLDLTSLPIVNKKMVQSISAFKLAALEFELYENQSMAKYVKQLVKENSSEKWCPMTYLEKGYSKEFIDYIISIGITEQNGFSPKVVAQESGDSYMGVYLETKLQKLSSVPKVDDVIKKINESKNLTLSESVMKSTIDQFNGICEKSYYGGISEDSKKHLRAAVSETYFTDTNNKRKQLLMEIAKIKFSLILSRQWFKEFETMDENEIEYTYFGEPLKVKFEYKEKQVVL